MADRDTGFHQLDADWTEGRAKAAGQANAIARAQIAKERRKVTLAKKDK